MIAMKIQRAIWTWRQPLTRHPTLANAPISDLFVWRSSSEWQTFFELIDIPSLFEDDSLPLHANLVFFDGSGRQILQRKVGLQANCRQTLDISSMVGRAHGETGTFAIFHSKTPIGIMNLGAFLAERGYVSYCFRDAPLRAFMHGNFDAIAQKVDGEFELLGGVSFLRRNYSLQHELQSDVVYELGFVNPTFTAQRCTCNLISVLSGKVKAVNINLPPGGVQLFNVKFEKIEPVRLVIESRLVMARPIVFRIQNFKLDVFHG
jgi:hypothetical protein